MANDPRPQFEAALRTATQVVKGVRPDQLRLPTPCEGMDVEELLFHLVGVLDRVALVGRGGNPFTVVRRPTLDGAWDPAAAECRAVWSDDAALDVESPLPWAPGDGGDALEAYVFEVTTHTWDLATATGQAVTWDDDVLSLVEAWVAEHMGTTPEERVAKFAPIWDRLPPGARDLPPPFADPQPVAEDAPAIDRIVAWSGRVRSSA